MHTADPRNQASGRTSSPSWLLPAGRGSVLGPVTSRAPHQATPPNCFTWTLLSQDPTAASALLPEALGGLMGALASQEGEKKKKQPPSESDKADPSPGVSLSNLFS